MAEVSVQVRDVDDRLAAEIAIVENLQRKDLNALEKGASFHEYLERYQCTQGRARQTAEDRPLDRGQSDPLARATRGCAGGAPAAARFRKGTPGPCWPLDSEHEQVEFCQRIQREGLSVRSVEDLVQQTVQAARGRRSPCDW